jgi:sulfate adenylyltransferase subunit 1 (EFTu-like GTPase family)
MDERPLDPNRMYLLKHTTKTVPAQVDHGMLLNQITRATVSLSRPITFDQYGSNRGTGSFILIDPSTNFTAGAGMIVEGVAPHGPGITEPSAAERIARLARAATTDADAVAAVRRALDELLS